MKHNSASRGRLVMVGPMVLFVGVFVVCCGILTCVFFRSAQLSREARQYNEAVVLCRSQAERLRAGETLAPETCFDAALAECGREDAAFLLRARSESREGCRAWTLTVCTPEGKAVYALEIYTAGEAGT